MRYATPPPLYRVHPAAAAELARLPISQRVVLQAADPERQESLVTENTPDPMEGEQTWPTDEELKAADAERAARRANGEEDEEDEEGGDRDGAAPQGGRSAAIPNPFTMPRRTKRVPKGTSSYQAAWILDSESEGEGDDDNDDDDEDEDDDGDAKDDNAMEARFGNDDDDDDRIAEDASGGDESEQEYEEVVVDEDLNALDTQLTENEEKEQLSNYLSRKGSGRVAAGCWTRVRACAAGSGCRIRALISLSEHTIPCIHTPHSGTAGRRPAVPGRSRHPAAHTRLDAIRQVPRTSKVRSSSTGPCLGRALPATLC